jgi:acetyltransferase-like isoleucine patch superfamily enzyme
MFKRFKLSAFFIYTKYKYRNLNIRMSGVSYINSQCKIEGHNSFGKNNRILNCSIGLGTYMGSSVRFSYAKIGRFCSIASNISNIYGNHPKETFVSTHPAFYSKGDSAGFAFAEKQLFTEITFISDNVLIEIGNDVWIAENVTILGNVKIGDGAIIGANSLVIRDVEPYSINVGSPAKNIGYRFNKETIDFLLKFKWWDKGFDWIKKNADDFKNIEEFKLKNKKPQ